MLIPGKSRSRDESRNSRVSIETLDVARVRSFTCVIGVGSSAGGITGWTRRRSRPMTGPHRRLRTINIAGSVAPKTAGGRVRGDRDRGSATAIGPPPERRARESPPQPVGRRWTISGRRGRDWRVKRWAAAGSPAPWHTCRNTCWERDGGTLLPTGCRVWESTGPPSDAAGRLADIACGRHI